MMIEGSMTMTDDDKDDEPCRASCVIICSSLPSLLAR